eukprot:gene7775-8586_t
MDNISIKRGLAFSWFSSILRTGNEKVLEMEDLPPLPADFDTQRCAEDLARATRVGGKQIKLSWMQVDKVVMGKISPLVWAIARCHGVDLVKVTLLRGLSCVLSFLSPLVLGEIVSFLDGEAYRQDLLWGLGLVSLLAFLSLAIAAINTNTNARSLDIKLKLQGSLYYAVYFRVMSLPVAAWSDLGFTEAQIQNFLQVDVDQIAGSLQNLHDLWLLPAQIVLAFVLLYLQVRLAFLAGVVLLLLLLPLNTYVAKKIGETTSSLMREKDRRMEVLVAALGAVASLKLCGMEGGVYKASSTFRWEEVRYLAWRKYLDAVCVFLWACTPVLVPFATFTTARLCGQRVSPAKTIVCLALLNTLIFPMNALPWVVNGFMEAVVSLRRMAKVLNGEDNCSLSLCLGFCQHEADFREEDEYTLPGVAYCYRNTSFSEASKEKLFGLASPLRVKTGHLYGIVGLTGCGKSSLLLGWLGELHSTEDSFQELNFHPSFSSAISADIPLLSTSRCSNDDCHPLPTGSQSVSLQCFPCGAAYVPSTPSLFSGSVRANILLGNAFDSARYDMVLRGTSLLTDLSSFDKHDLHEVGSQASALSTGQVLRVAIARALYSKSPVVILDDPFSALDSTTATTLMNYLVHQVAHREGRAVLIASHHLHLLAPCETIVLLNEGREVARGDFPALSSSCPPFQALLANKDKLLSHGITEKRSATVSVPSDSSVSAKETTAATIAPLSESEEVEEEKARGAIAKDVVLYYFSAMGWLSFTILLLSLIGMQATNLAVVNYYSYAAGQSSSETSDEEFFQNSSLLLAANIAFTILRSGLFAQCGLRAATLLYDELVQAVLGASSASLEEVSLGQLTNRLGRDANTVDDSLPFILNILLAQIAMFLSAAAVVIVNAPVVLVVLVAVLWLYYPLQRNYRAVSRELRRLESVSRSPLYTFYLDSLQCATTLRHLLGGGAQWHAQQTLLNKANLSIKVSLLIGVAQQYLNLRLQLLATLLTASLALFLVLMAALGGPSLSPFSSSAGLAGLALLYSSSFVSTANALVNALAETEQDLVAVERMRAATRFLRRDSSLCPNTFTTTTAVAAADDEKGQVYSGQREGKKRKGGYTALLLSEEEEEEMSDGLEAGLLSADHLPPPPPASSSSCVDDSGLFSFASGEGISIRNLFMRYPSSERDVLHDVCLEVKPGSRVAVLGRTGCGKTSLLRCLLRLVPYHSGSIRLGGRDLQGITGLRGSVSTLPQKCLLFAASLLDNLRLVRSGITAEEVKEVLRDHGDLTALLLATFNISSEPSDGKVDDAGSGNSRQDVLDRLLQVRIGSQGSNLSSGQGQLVSLLRALMVKSDLLLLDEVSAALDNLSALCVYDILRRHCLRKPWTILFIICHKLQDVSCLCNKVVHLEEGRVVAFEDLDDDVETL